MPTSKQYADALSSPSWTDRALPMEGRAAFLPFQDTMPGSVMNKRSLAIPGVFAGAINAITAPGRAYRGSDPTFNPQEEALNIGLNMMGGGMVASKVAPPPAGALGIFAGSRAKTADMGALKVAEDMKASGVPDKAIHAKTGWFFGMPDGKPRFEIDDSGASIKNFGRNQDDSMINVLDHQGLYDAYPAQQYTHANITSETTLPPHMKKLLIGKGEGSYNHTGYGGEPLIEAQAFSPKDTSVTLHELQHAIQQREGFAKGGSPEQFPLVNPTVDKIDFSAISPIMEKYGISGDDLNDDAFSMLNSIYSQAKAKGAKDIELKGLLKQQDIIMDLTDKALTPHQQYQRLAGEAEARLTQSRMNMTAGQRAASYPPSMFDVPVKDQIVRYGDGQAMSKFPKTDGEIRSEIAQRNAALPISEGGLGLPANNMPMDRAGAMGFDTPAYTGVNTIGEIDEMFPKSWFTESPKFASDYSSVIPASGVSGNPRVYPVMLKTGNIKSQPYFGLYDDMNKALSKKKTNTFKIENVGGGLDNNYVTKDANQIRSRFAAFDPFRKHEADILAGVGIGGMLDPEAVSEEFRKKERK